MSNKSHVDRIVVGAEINAPLGGGGTVRGVGVAGAANSGIGITTVTLDDGFASQEMGFSVTCSSNNAAGLVASWTRTSEKVITIQTHLVSTGAPAASSVSLLGWMLPAGDIATT